MFTGEAKMQTIPKFRACTNCNRTFKPAHWLDYECAPCQSERDNYAAEARSYERDRADERWERA